MNPGKVFLVGAGPGDMGLVTLKAASCVQAADVIIYDQLVNPELLSFAPKHAEIIFAGKYAGNHILAQKETNRLLVKRSREGKMVVRLKGGDPLLFGRGAEEALELAQARVPFEIVPGVSSAYSVPAYAGIPVTYRNIASRLNIVTGHETPDKGKATIPWKRLLDENATLVILMGFNNIATIMRQIGRDKKSLAMPVAVINNGTRPTQTVVTGKVSNIVARVKAAGMKPPAIIVVGKVVGLREKLNWFKPEPLLNNKRVLIVRPEHQTGSLAGLLEQHGAKVTSIPLISIVPSKNTAAIKAKLSDLDVYDWFIFTSVNGVDLFVKALRQNKISMACLKGRKFAAIGKKTAEQLEAAGIKVSLVPKDFVQEALADAMIQEIAQGSARVLLPHSAGSRPVLEQKLRDAGLKVDTLDLYSAQPLFKNHAQVLKLFRAHKVDAVMLTSSSCVESFVSVFPKARLNKETQDVVVAAIGPITASTAKALGLTVSVEAREYTIEGITKALIEHFIN